MDGGLIRLKAIVDSLPASEKKIAEYILNHPERVVQATVSQLSEWSGGSTAAIIRLCKSVDVSGFQELKLKIAGDLMGEQKQEYTEIRPNDTIDNIIQSVSTNNIQSIRDTMKVIDPVLVEKAVDALERSDRLHFYGIGASSLIAIDAQNKFMRINKTSFAFIDTHAQLMDATALRPEDTVVCISYSGESSLVIQCMKYAKESGCSTISITRWSDNTLSSMADIPLKITSTENEVRSGATSSRITQLNLIDILYLGVVSRNFEQSVRYLEKSRKAIRGSSH
ncbi:MurR/RpiR family transcriptional regulator [Paenibacillus sp. NPDC058071]|uniref:MurR/RpiR family transcriptional regulator n=1 Tax=Paenibacillus sp. NPDC058071 TaxID=3346326 RepID=UPI0036D95845